ncbi:MAG TPA: recombinase family protein [Candidatus Sulfotelmatobacter sp.]|nr:recombinase family protein [Candidatus Sulfotelmatobacter sp.]
MGKILIWEGTMGTRQTIPAAQYLRMSTEQQQYSLENQAVCIQRYAASKGFEIVQTYFDPGKSGLSLRHRSGLRQLLKDVVDGSAQYLAVLVYDVSRWGRFQDSDEAAHYEFLCKSAGVPIHYCAETFPNDGSIPSLVLKALKRVMAGEYSRELSERVFAGQKKIAQLGYKMGGLPCFGYRRMLVSTDGARKQLLQRGERKSLASDRVILVRGPEQEVELVNEIFRMFTEKQLGVKTIARELNRRGVPTILKGPKGRWNHSVITRMLLNPTYTGANVFNRRTMRLGSTPQQVPRCEWVIKAGSHDPIVSSDTFTRAQQRLANMTLRKSDEKILAEVRDLLERHGRLSTAIIEKTPGIASVRCLVCRFGSLARAYELIGYDWKHKCVAAHKSEPTPKHSPLLC